MNSVKIGDKVRFLNSVGGGVVKAFGNKGLVMVEDENGFDFPVRVAECVVVEESRTRPKGMPDARTAAPETSRAESNKSEMEYKPEEVPGGERLNVSLAYLPVDAKNLVESGYEAYLINESNYELAYSYMCASNRSWTLRAQGTVEPNTRIFLEEFGKEQLANLERLCVQLFAFKRGKPFGLKNAISMELRMDTVKFYKPHCFGPNDYFEEGAIVVPIVRGDVPERPLLIPVAELEEAMMQKARDDRRRPQAAQAKPKEKEGETVEVDLHIGQLLDDTTGMTPGDMLRYQVDRFHEVMQKYAGRKGQRIVFIHGKGEGVLRAAIEKELKTKYKSCEYQDASFREYGFGATLVKIR
ncbi:mannonate oxidoreductase [Tannerella sp. oral taxon 808]|nr:mannonate oxidoreductase [Tannerella sp. oral taxon 808]